jgi:hypothetical protein
VTTFYKIIKYDGFVKSRHSRVGGNPESAKLLKRLDSRFHGNDENEHFQTFYEIIKDDFYHFQKIVLQEIMKT